VGLWLAEHHDAWPWNASRWAFASERMAELTPLHWHADRATLSQALAGARSVQTTADPHISALLPPQVVQRSPQALFAEVNLHCRSFSTWWNRTTKGIKTLNDLPGLAALAASSAASPLPNAAPHLPANRSLSEHPR
jgi:deoxyribodipyrimidine photo-lyase